MNKVEASAPGKLMLFGEHSVVYGYPSIVTAVGQRIFVEVQEKNDDKFSVIAPEQGVDDYTKSIAHLGDDSVPRAVVFLEFLYKRFIEQYPKACGVQVTTRSEFSSQFGFGSSSAVTVAFAKALSELFEIKITKNELFQLCYKTVIDVQNIGSGFDLASAIWGGTIYYVKPAKIVQYLTSEEPPLVVGYTGIKADTTRLVRMVEQEKKNNPMKITKIFEEITRIVELAKTEIIAQNWLQVGRLMTENQLLLEELGVSSPELQTLIQASNSAGAFGAKLSGAGGGDCMIAVSSAITKSTIERNIEKANGQVLRVHTNAVGTKLERVHDL